MGRDVAVRGDAWLARTSRSFGRRRLRELGAGNGRVAAADVGTRRCDLQFAAGERVRRAVGDAARDHVRHRRIPDAAAALDQRRPADHFFPGRRAGDQARVHRWAPRQPAFGRVSDRRRARWHGGAGRVVLLRHPERAMGAWMGRAHGDGHRIRRGADRDAWPARARRAAHLPDGRGNRR